MCWVGSPPCMRGKDHQTFQLVLRDGITPACAGKSRPCVVHVCRTEDHPRVCGEKALSTFSSLKNSGSPPHVRGKVQTEFCMIVIGKDHPRVCGEKWPQNIHEYHRLGITPAYAGKRLKRSRSTVPPVAIVPLFPSVCNKPVASDGSPAGRDAPLFLPAENAVPASPAYNLRSL